MNLEFPGYISTMCYHCMNRQIELIGYRFIGHTFYYANYNFLLALTQGFRFILLLFFYGNMLQTV